MASGPSTPSAVVQRDAPRSGFWLTPTRVAILVMLLLCILQVCLRAYDANAQAEVEAAAALAAVEQQPPQQQGEVFHASLPPSFIATLRPRDGVLSLGHCSLRQCSVVYARSGELAGAARSVCEVGLSWPVLCASVPSKAHPGDAMRVAYDLQPALQSALVGMGVTILMLSGMVLLWRSATRGLKQDKAESVLLVQQATDRDPLTGLLNRVAFEQALRRHNERKTGSPSTTDGCLMYFDLDRFKIINDSHGHLMGDQVLKTVAKRLRYTLGSDVPIGRLGGDEFAVLLVDVSSQATIEQMGRVVIDQVSKPIQMDAIKDSVGLSIGAFMLTRGALTVGEMLHRADLAMYEAKKAGRGRLVFFEDSMDEASRSRAQIQVDLRQALQESQMFMVYQPQVDCYDSIRGVESLVRWRHPTKGLINAEEFISAAEQSGLIVPLGKMILDLVCRDLVALRAQRLTLPYVSVNLSLKQLADANFVADMQSTLASHGLSANDIEFEITEGTAMAGRSAQENATLNQLSEQGFRIAIDDFGTGYSSMGRLLDLKVDKLKFDRVFIAAIGNPRFDPALLELMISLANRLGVKSVAEGVETLDQVVWLRQAGCQMMQGNLYAKPMNHAQLVSWLRLQEGDGDFADGVWSPTQTMEEEASEA